MMDVLMTPLPAIAGIAIFLLIFPLIVYLLVSNSRQRRRLDRLLGATGDRESLESLLLEYMETVRTVNERCAAIHNRIDHLDEGFRQCIRKVALIRYNPFDSMGGDLSFVLALLDDDNSGVVINTIRGRDTCYTYAKPIVRMESNYALSAEEKNAVVMAAGDS